MLPALLLLPIYLSYLLFSLCLSWWQLLACLGLFLVRLAFLPTKFWRLFWQLRGFWLAIALLAWFFTPGQAIWPQQPWSPTWSGLQLATSRLLWLWQALAWFVLLWHKRPWPEVLAIFWWWSRFWPGLARARFWGKVYLTIWYAEYFWQHRPEKSQNLIAWKVLWQSTTLVTSPPDVFVLELPPNPPWWQWLLTSFFSALLLYLCLIISNK